MTMKISKRDLTLLLIIFGALIAFCTYQFYYRGAVDEKKKYEEENEGFEKRLNALRSIDDQKLIQTMAQNVQNLEKKAEVYPSEYKLEDLIMYLNEWEQLPYEEMYYFKKYELEETLTPIEEAGVIDWDSTNKVQKSVRYAFGSATLSAEYEANSYKALKDIINKIYLDSAPKSIANVTAVMNGATGEIQGKMELTFYNVAAYGADGMPTKAYAPVKIDEMPTGVENVFGPTYTPTPSPTPSVAPTPRFAAED